MSAWVRGVAGGPFARREWAAWLNAMLAEAGRLGLCPFRMSAGTEAALDLLLVRDGRMAALNARHMGCPGPTNILSFPAEDGDRLGSLALSVDTLDRECRLYGQDRAEHARRLLAHGLAHVLGYDHGPAMDELCLHLREAAAENRNAKPERFVDAAAESRAAFPR